ncbi:hypothetical protein DL769_010566 [Monosporascus sp. CRB-8-3]|nr:hypothetical protein DL769_010566 [Monosporascus sp. CRB-8-3]
MTDDGPETGPEMVEDPPAHGGQAQRQQRQHQPHGCGGGGGGSGLGNLSRRGHGGGHAQAWGPPRAGVTGYGHSSPLLLTLAPEPEPASYGLDESLLNNGQLRRRPSPSPSSSPSRISSLNRIGGHHYQHQREYPYLEEEELPLRLRQPHYPSHHRQRRDSSVPSFLPRRPDPHPYPEELDDPFIADHENYHGPEQQQPQRDIPHHRGGGRGNRGIQRNPRGRQELLPQELLWQQHQQRDNNNNTQRRRRGRRPRNDRPGQQQQYQSPSSNPWFAAPGEGFEDYGYLYGPGGGNHQPATTARRTLDEDSKGDLEVTEIMDRDSRSRRRRSRSFDRDRNGRDRTPPPRPSSPPVQRGSTYRGRSRSAERRDDRYVASYHRRPSPPRDSAMSSAVPSRDTSRRPSPPGGPPGRRDDRSRPESPIPSRPLSRSSHGVPARDRSPQRTPVEPSSAAARSPPRGPAAFRPPPTGPRDSRGYGVQSATAIGPPPRPAPAPAAPSSRHETSRNAPAPSPTLNRQEMNTSPGAPPSGPRSHFSSRGGGYGRGGRGGSAWGPPVQSRNLSPTAGPASASPGTTGSAIPPTGPRGSISSHSVPSTPAALSQSKPFDPPKGPAADKNKPSFAQQLLASMPPLVPGGKADPAQLAMDAGVLPELLAHTQRLKEEEERIREEKYLKEERLRKSLAEWDRMERESRVMELRDQLAEETLKKISGEGTGGAAF